MFRRMLLGALLVCALGGPARAAPYWVAYEGNDFPENEGWERIVNGVGPAERSLADGILTIDGRADRQIDDFYRMDRLLDPDLGEEFVMQWRLRVQDVDGNPPAYDPGVAVFSDDDWTVSLLFGNDFISSFHEDIEIPIEPGVFHSVEFRSFDMRTYDLFVDGALIHVGTFWEPTFRQSRIDWGDRARGSASLSDWDYFRFGVVPEPGTLWLLFALVCFSGAIRKTGVTK